MSLALYRKYRPGRLDDVIGQDHVIEPLKRALSSDRVHHAYLFSGPRGCGKTSSARILARSLNCEQGPTPDPCGECNSCRDLAPNGPGSIDVIELDAATHGLVDDARDLREKAVYAPASSRYKIYIIDEAHQLGPGAANALLKLVEEPPPHLRFVFATTEPEKIIGTIRSRTHHYGFRLVPSRILQTHLAWTCEQEGLTADPAALALVARAAGGSVRDALSILGQLLAGAGPDGLTYEDAVAQLGVTDAALIDQIIVALAERDGSQLFRLVDSVIEAGHDPRRFVADLLDRFRDLLIVSQVPDAAEAGLIEGQPERVQELVAQASQFGPGELSRSADVISRGLSDLKGATAPRLQIELLIARVILPSAESKDDSLLTRIEQLERAAKQNPSHARMGSTPPAAPKAPDGPPVAPVPTAPAVTHPADPSPAPPMTAEPPVTAEPKMTAEPPVSAQAPASGFARLSDIAPSTAGGEPARPADVEPSPADSDTPQSVDEDAAAAFTDEDSAPVVAEGDDTPASDAPAFPGAEADVAQAPVAVAAAAAEPAPAEPAPTAVPATGSDATIEQVRAVWPAVLDEVKSGSRVAWMLVVDAEPVSVEGGVLVATHVNPGTVKRFSQSGHDARINQALTSVVGVPLSLQLTAGSPGTTPRKNATGNSSTPEPPAQTKEEEADAEVADSTDADDLAGIALVERELGAVKITEFDEG